MQYWRICPLPPPQVPWMCPTLAAVHRPMVTVLVVLEVLVLVLQEATL